MGFLDRVLRLVNGGKEDSARYPGDCGAESSVPDVERFEREYRDLSGINLTSIIAVKLANIVCSDAVIEAGVGAGGNVAEAVIEAGAGAGGNVAEAVNEAGAGGTVAEAVRRCANELREIVAWAFGTGGVILRPYERNGRIYTERLPQSRFFIIKSYGDNITKAGILADLRREGRRELVRVETHELMDDGRYVIENRAFDGEREIPIGSVPEWDFIKARHELRGMDGMLFARLKCPVETRGGGSAYGVPITYGQKRLLAMIAELIEEVPLEYRNKRAFIGAEDLLFDSRERLPESGVYRLLRGNGGDNRSFWEIFSPEIRHTSYFEGLNYLFGLLEKAVSVNKGILTDLDTSDATATAIKRSTFDTYNLVNAMRRNVETAFGELARAYAALSGGEAPPALRFDWSYSLLEDTSETFSQLMDAYNAGIATAEEVRRFLF